MQVWKVIMGGDRGSITNTTYSLIYPYRKWVKPKIGRIFCFKNVDDAKVFLGSTPYNDCRIVPAEAKDVRIKRKVAERGDGQSILSFWKNSRVFKAKAPQGTYTCSAIKCLQ